jgi:hypothetical protein
MQKQTIYGLVTGTLLVLGSSAWAVGSPVGARTPIQGLPTADAPVNCSGRTGGGGSFPFGPNTLAELAENELYQLRGKVRVRRSDGSAFLEIDFCDHPWLATAKRRAYPFYILGALPNGGTWTKYQDLKVEVAVRARGEVLFGDDYQARYVIWLEPQFTPVYVRPGVR